MTNRFGILPVGHHYAPARTSPEEESRAVAAQRRKVVLSRGEKHQAPALRLRDQRPLRDQRRTSDATS